MFAIVLLCLCAESEPIPAEMRKYFEAQEVVFEKAVKQLQAAIKAKEVQATGEPVPRKKALFETQAKKLRVQLQELEKGRFEAKPDIELPAGNQGIAHVGQVGLLPECKLKAAVDGVPVVTCNVIYGRTIVLSDVDSKSLHLVKAYRSDALWIVRANTTEDVRLRPYLNGRGGGADYYFVSKLDRKEVNKHRQNFDAERKKVPSP